MSNLFVSYDSEDAADAEDIANHLENVFQDGTLEVFRASESVRPGDAWQDKIISALTEADVLLVLMTIDALNSRWVNFEIGMAWARGARILLFCNRGMSLAALPTPYNTLQAVDINGMTYNEKMNRVAEVVGESLNIRLPESLAQGVGLASTTNSVATTVQSWNLRPAAHVEATIEEEFLVGTVRRVNPARAIAAGLNPGETLFVRLFFGRSPGGRYINAMASGDAASFLERITRDTVIVRATIRLAAAFEDGENVIPLLVADKVQEISRQ